MSVTASYCHLRWFTYTQASSGGSYVVTTGLFAVGGIQTLLGLCQMMKG